MPFSSQRSSWMMAEITMTPITAPDRLFMPPTTSIDKRDEGDAQIEGVGIHDAEEMRVERAGHADDEGRDHEGDEPLAHDVDAGSRGRRRLVARRRAAPGLSARSDRDRR